MTKKLRGARKPNAAFQTSIQLSAQEIVRKGKQAAVFLHRGIAGDERAAGLAEFLRSTIPAKFGVAKGEVIDFQGNQTTQLDLIIYDHYDSAVLFRGEDGNLLIPAESVYAVVECKTTLNQNELNASFSAAKRLKDLRPYQKHFKSERSLAKFSEEDGRLLPRCKYSLFSFGTNATKSSQWLKTELTRARVAASAASAHSSDVDDIVVLERGIFIPAEAKGKVYAADSTNAFMDWYLAMMNFLQRESKRRQPADLQIYSYRYQRGWVRIDETPQ